MRCRIVKDVDDALRLSQIYEVRIRDLGHAWVLFFFSIVVCLIDSTLNDWELLSTSLDRPTLEFGGADDHNMEIDSKESHNCERNENRKQLQRMNSLMAVEVLGKLTESRKAMVLLRLVRLNMYAPLFLILFYASKFLPVTDTSLFLLEVDPESFHF